MILNKRWKSLSAVAATAAVIASLSAGCSSVNDLQNGLCCKTFVVGQDLVDADFGVDASVKGSFNAYAQAGGDLSATATATLGDVTTACQNIALDLGADPGDSSLDGKTGSALTKAWCKLAATQIGADFGANGSLGGDISIDFNPPVCTASIQATASCEGSCDASATCDVKAHPPTCQGGTLVVDCQGSCTAQAGVDLECTGACTGGCTGTCTATGGAKVDCKGTCDGKCSAAADGGSTTGTGIQADGSCDGQCDGTCTIDASTPKIKCAGTCDGHCSATCKGSADASVKCNGNCDADYTPLKCEGGTLKASCNVDAHCEASCNASASAKAQCTPPSVSVNAEIAGDADATAYAAAIDSLETNLPNLLLAVEGRGELFIENAGVAVTAGGEIASGGGLNAQGAVCAVDIAAAIAQAVSNMTDAVSAASSVTASVHVGS